ncbi:Ger(x)C family spore germination protein [Jeotgalibacillus campisalis]|uniref:Uncharacterized protein n=1 Tax=Jeotgalibacillus campisalis TaxID=220754 RepID=A0A0C2RDP9_9BACL|nr:Ger(x)C family spore germination protein [Jeotgalibacillus campisalis]KIL48390.1 hypothetical protein KR50_14260 [Jeotgalibacillus campisalis]
MLKKIILFSVLPFLIFPLSGCWDNRDINHRVMPISIGVSKMDEGYKVFLQIPEPAPDRLGTRIVTGEGETINQIIDNISVNMESAVDLLHVKVIVVDKRLAEEGLNDLISGFIRSRDVSAKAVIAICDDDIDQFFQSMENSEGQEGTILLDYFEKYSGWDPHIALSRVWEVYRSSHSYTRDVAIPMLKRGQTTFLEIVGSAVIKNGKLVEVISSDETLLYNAFKNKSTRGKIEVLDQASVMVISNDTDYKTEFTDQTPSLQTTFNFSVMILETNGNPSAQEIKKNLEELLLDRYKALVVKLKTSEADILGIGQHFRKEIPRKDLKNWRSDYYPNLEFNPIIHVDIQNYGNLKHTAN